LAVPGPNGEAVIRNTATGEVISQLSGRGQRLKCVAFSEDGRLLATGSNDGTVQLWDGANGRSLAQPLGSQSPPVSAVAFSHDGRHLITCHVHGFVEIWD